MEIKIITPSDDFGCSPCWLQNQRDVNATVKAIDDSNHYCYKEVYLCGNHAEVLVDKREEKNQRG